MIILKEIDMKYLNYLCLLLLFSCSTPIRKRFFKKPITIKSLRRSDRFENCAVRFAKLDFESEAILGICKEAYKPIK